MFKIYYAVLFRVVTELYCCAFSGGYLAVFVDISALGVLPREIKNEKSVFKEHTPIIIRWSLNLLELKFETN